MKLERKIYLVMWIVLIIWSKTFNSYVNKYITYPSNSKSVEANLFKLHLMVCLCNEKLYDKEKSFLWNLFREKR